MPVRYEIYQRLELADPAKPEHGFTPIVMVVTGDEFDELTFLESGVRDELDKLEQAESNYVEIFADYLIGSFSIPDKENVMSVETDLISFYLDRKHLIFVDNGALAADLMEKIQASGIMRNPTVGHCLALFFAALLEYDLVFLGRLEDTMEDMESAMLESSREITTREIVDCRRFCTRISAYYQQLAAMADTIADDENRLIDQRDIATFQHASRQADRLVNRSETLVSYSTQLRELYQTQIDLKQNSIMQVFTIVTVLFVPLTLVTGWFGMNLEYLPGLDWPYMVPFLLIVAAILLGFLLVFFHRKKWL